QSVVRNGRSRRERSGTGQEFDDKVAARGGGGAVLVEGKGVGVAHEYLVARFQVVGVVGVGIANCAEGLEGREVLETRGLDEGVKFCAGAGAYSDGAAVGE